MKDSESRERIKILEKKLSELDRDISFLKEQVLFDKAHAPVISVMTLLLRLADYLGLTVGYRKDGKYFHAKKDVEQPPPDIIKG